MAILLVTPIPIFQVPASIIAIIALAYAEDDGVVDRIRRAIGMGLGELALEN